MKAVNLLLITGSGLLILSFVMHMWGFSYLEKYFINKETALKEGTMAYNIWKKIPFPAKFKVYFFNVTNPDDVQNGETAILQEIGPYVYDEWITKEILDTNEINDTVSYVQYKTFYFNANESGSLKDTDQVTILNSNLVLPALKIEELAPNAVSIINTAVPFLFPGVSSIFMTETVKNILYDGTTMHCEAEEVETVCSLIKAQMPPTLRLAPNNRDILASMFYHGNATKLGPYTIKRGIQNNLDRGALISYKNAEDWTMWTGACNKIYGRDMSLFPNLEIPIASISVFIEDFCRSMKLEYSNLTPYKNIPVQNYVMDTPFGDTLQDHCYCDQENDDNGLLKCKKENGIMQIGPCVEAPIILSMPHFYMGDVQFLDKVRGLAPKKEDHESFARIEPKSGAPIVSKVRVQVNVPLHKVEGMDLMENVTEALFPILWIENGAELPDNLRINMEQNFNKLSYLVFINYLIVGIGLAMLVSSLLLSMYIDNLGFLCNEKSNKVAPKNGSINVISGTKLDNLQTLSVEELNQRPKIH